MTRFINIRDAGDLNMTAIFAGDPPTREDIYSAQCNAGYGANGYPQNVKIQTLKDGCLADPVSVVTFKLQGTNGKTH